MPEMLQRPPSQPVASSNPRPAPPAQPTPAQPSEPLVRGQAPDKEAPPAQAQTLPVKLRVPPPEEVGLAANEKQAAKPEVSDWNAARQRLDEMGATLYRLEKAEGGFRFVCALPYPGGEGKECQFEAVQASESAAIRAVFAKLSAWQTELAASHSAPTE